jgi:hypothetical protein
MAVAAPNNVAGALPAYGPNGSCWAPDAGVAATCDTACINGLAQLKKLAPGAPECNGAPATGNPTAILTVNLRDGATQSPAKGITAAAVGHSAVSGANGALVLTVPASTPVSPTFIGPGFVNSTFQELTLSGDTDLGSVNLLSTDDFHLLTQALPGYDTGKGVIAVDIVAASGGCNPGGSVSVSPSGATVMYTRHGLPDGSATALDPAESPAAIIYNASPGVAVTLSVSQSGCHAASPMTIGNATLSGRVTAQAGDAVSLARLILN